ncbi:MAG: hypothetical protein RO469_15950 [Thermincola sp.]|jgi:F0F1-type ATP synthase assembly protein I|nr:hypothetical protein [Thermincola sp.]MDT3704525.1 hypothetical protein [Thermincola sp.]
MNERRLSATQKKLIFVIGICVIFIVAALFSYIDPESKGSDFGKIIIVLPALVGLGAAMLTQEKTRTFKIVVFCIGTALVLASWSFFSLSDVGKVLGLYVGGFLAGTKWSKSSLVADILNDKTDESGTKKTK